MISRTQRQAIKFSKSNTRAFSNALVVPTYPNLPKETVMSIVDYSHMKTAEKQVLIDADAAHQANMVRISSEKGVFTPMEVNEADNGHLKKIKS